MGFDRGMKTIEYLIYGIGLTLLAIILVAGIYMFVEQQTTTTAPTTTPSTPTKTVPTTTAPVPTTTAPTTTTTAPTTVAPTQKVPLKIESVNVEYDSRDSKIDKIIIRINNVTIRNIGKDYLSQKVIFEAVVKGVKSSVKDYIILGPGKTYSLLGTYLLYLSIERYPGEYKYVGTLYLKDESGSVLDEKSFTVSIPTARIGDTIIVNMIDGKKFDLRLNSWRIEPNRYDRNKVDVVVSITVRNSYSRNEEFVPFIEGVVMTDKGYVYGYGHSSLYCPTRDPLHFCPSTLLPGESFTGELRIEGMPKDWKPVELRISCPFGDVREIIVLSG